MPVRRRCKERWRDGSRPGDDDGDLGCCAVCLIVVCLVAAYDSIVGDGPRVVRRSTFVGVAEDCGSERIVKGILEVGRRALFAHCARASGEGEGA